MDGYGTAAAIVLYGRAGVEASSLHFVVSALPTTHHSVSMKTRLESINSINRHRHTQMHFISVT